MRNGQYQPARPSQIQFDKDVSCIARRAPLLDPRLIVAACFCDRCNHLIRKVAGDICEFGTRSADHRVRQPEVSRANGPGAIAAAATVVTAVIPTARGASVRTTWREDAAVDVAYCAVQFTGKGTRDVAHGDEVRHAVHCAIRYAHARMRGASSPLAGCAGGDLVDGEHRIGLMPAGRAVFLTHQTPRAIGAPQMRRAMNEPVDLTPRLMSLAHDSAKACAPRHFVRPYDLARAALTGANAVAAKPP